jgi:hypothetical protein
LPTTSVAPERGPRFTFVASVPKVLRLKPFSEASAFASAFAWLVLSYPSI